MKSYVDPFLNLKRSLSLLLFNMIKVRFQVIFQDSRTITSNISKAVYNDLLNILTSIGKSRVKGRKREGFKKESQTYENKEYSCPNIGTYNRYLYVNIKYTQRGNFRKRHNFKSVQLQMIFLKLYLDHHTPFF